MTPHSDTLQRLRVNTPVKQGYDAIIEVIDKLVTDLEATAGSRCTVGICTPGSISSSTGLLKNSNMTCLNNRDIKNDIEAALDRPVLIENDANCFTLSEAMDGAASNFKLVFGIIMGTGVGGGLVFNKRLHVGRHHIAGEWGHNVLDDEGPECYCGKRGCVEVFLSGPGLLYDWRDEDTRPHSVPGLLKRAKSHDSNALEVLERFFQRFGKAVSTVINILDPDAVVLGGGLSNIQDLYTRGAEALGNQIFNNRYSTPVLKNQHGDSSGVRGAAQLWVAGNP